MATAARRYRGRGGHRGWSPPPRFASRLRTDRCGGGPARRHTVSSSRPSPLRNPPSRKCATRSAASINQERGIHGFRQAEAGRLDAEGRSSATPRRWSQPAASPTAVPMRRTSKPVCATPATSMAPPVLALCREHRLRAERRGDGGQLARQSFITGFNILDPDFRDIGVGFSKKPVSGRCMKAYRDLHSRLRSARPVAGAGRDVRPTSQSDSQGAGGQCRIGSRWLTAFMKQLHSRSLPSRLC